MLGRAVALPNFFQYRRTKSKQDCYIGVKSYPLSCFLIYFKFERLVRENRPFFMKTRTLK